MAIWTVIFLDFGNVNRVDFNLTGTRTILKRMLNLLDLNLKTKLKRREKILLQEYELNFLIKEPLIYH